MKLANQTVIDMYLNSLRRDQTDDDTLRMEPPRCEWDDLSRSNKEQEEADHA
jgi:hypothetical protein